MSDLLKATFYRTTPPLIPFEFAWATAFCPEEEVQYFWDMGWVRKIDRREVERDKQYEVAEELCSNVMFRYPVNNGKQVGEAKVPFKDYAPGRSGRWQGMPYLCNGLCKVSKEIRGEHLEKIYDVSFYMVEDNRQLPPLAVSMKHANKQPYRAESIGDRLYRITAPLGEALREGENVGANLAVGQSKGQISKFIDEAMVDREAIFYIEPERGFWCRGKFGPNRMRGPNDLSAKRVAAKLRSGF